MTHERSIVFPSADNSPFSQHRPTQAPLCAPDRRMRAVVWLRRGGQRLRRHRQHRLSQLRIRKIILTLALARITGHFHPERRSQYSVCHFTSNFGLRGASLSVTRPLSFRTQFHRVRNLLLVWIYIAYSRKTIDAAHQLVRDCDYGRLGVTVTGLITELGGMRDMSSGREKANAVLESLQHLLGSKPGAI